MKKAITIRNLSERALLVEFGQEIDILSNINVIQLSQKVTENPFPGFMDTIISYSSLTIIYEPVIIKKEINPNTPIHVWVAGQIRFLVDSLSDSAQINAPLIRIPVWYPHTPDLIRLAEKKGRTPGELIEIHQAQSYRVFMLGFQPGFAYMGILPEILHCKRKESPVPVKAGSVAIAGKQTGIYPFDSPGGWQVIGFTPWQLFNKHQPRPVWLQPGDEVMFYPVSADEFEYLEQLNKQENDITY